MSRSSEKYTKLTYGGVMNSVSAHIAKKDFDSAMAELEELIRSVSLRHGVELEIVPTEGIDRTIEGLSEDFAGLGFSSGIVDQESAGRVMVLTSRLLKTGGHSREIEDWVKNFPAGGEIIVALTREHEESHRETVEGVAKNVKVLTHSILSPMERVRQILQWIREYKPRTIIVSPSIDDASLFVSVAMLDSSIQVVLNLNLDHALSPGLTLRRWNHVIVRRTYLMLLLGEEKGMKNLVYLPLAREGVANPIQNPLTDRLVTFSCTSSDSKITRDYDYPFDTVIAEMIVRCGVKHVHVGAISVEGKKKLIEYLEANGVADRFVHIRYSPTLEEVYREHGVHVAIQTFPIEGGLVVVEAMRSGLLVINHRNYRSKLYNASDICYPGAFLWAQPEELYELIGSINQATLDLHAAKACEHFTTVSKGGRLEAMLASGIFSSAEMDMDTVRAAYAYEIDPFRICADSPFRARKRFTPMEKISREMRRFWKSLAGGKS